MKNTNALRTKEFEEIKIDTKSTEDAEAAIIKEHLGQIKVSNMDITKEEALIKALMQTLSTEKQEGERVTDFENRVKQEVSKVLDVDL
jgi:sulfite reductase beta subunit-like hemoprotein